MVKNIAVKEIYQFHHNKRMQSDTLLLASLTAMGR
jgi:hypothetical protein